MKIKEMVSAASAKFITIFFLGRGVQKFKKISLQNVLRAGHFHGCILYKEDYFLGLRTLSWNVSIAFNPIPLIPEIQGENENHALNEGKWGRVQNWHPLEGNRVNLLSGSW